MNNKKRYHEGKRRLIVRELLNNVCIPTRDFPLLADNPVTFCRQIYIMKSEGILRRVCDNGIQFYVFDNYSDHIDDIKNAATPNEKLIKYYEVFGVNERHIAVTYDRMSKNRIVRNAETSIFCETCGIETEIGNKPTLYGSNLPPEAKVFFNSRELKNANDYTVEKNKDTGQLIGKTFVNGLIVSPGGTYLVIDCYDWLLEFDYGEFKINSYIEALVAEKKLPEYKGVILLFDSYDTQYEYLTSERVRYVRKKKAQIPWIKNWTCLVECYPKVYGINLNKEGQRMLRMMTEKDWDKKSHYSFLSDKPRRENCPVECDGQDDDSYYLNFCVPDIKKLRTFVNVAKLYNDKNQFKIICYEWQKDFVLKVSAGSCRIFVTS